jgi:hypothetical protein
MDCLHVVLELRGISLWRQSSTRAIIWLFIASLLLIGVHVEQGFYQNVSLISQLTWQINCYRHKFLFFYRCLLLKSRLDARLLTYTVQLNFLEQWVLKVVCLLGLECLLL